MYPGNRGSRSTEPVRLNWLRGDWQEFYFIISINKKKQNVIQIKLIISIFLVDFVHK